MSWVLTEVPAGAFFVARRTVRIMERRGRRTRRFTDDFVFGSQAPMWTVELCPSIKCTRKAETSCIRMEELRRRTGKLDRYTFDLEDHSFKKLNISSLTGSMNEIKEAPTDTEEETTASCNSVLSSLTTDDQVTGRTCREDALRCLSGNLPESPG